MRVPGQSYWMMDSARMVANPSHDNVISQDSNLFNLQKQPQQWSSEYYNPDDQAYWSYQTGPYDQPTQGWCDYPCQNSSGHWVDARDAENFTCSSQSNGLFYGNEESWSFSEREIVSGEQEEGLDEVKHSTPPPRHSSQRQAANLRERRRMHSINHAFEGKLCYPIT